MKHKCDHIICAFFVENGLSLLLCLCKKLLTSINILTLSAKGIKRAKAEDWVGFCFVVLDQVFF